MSNYNPYAAPSAEPGVPTAGSSQLHHGEPQPWDVGCAIKSAWEIYKGHWAPLTLGYLVISAIAAVPQYMAPVLAAIGILEEGSGQYWAVHGPLTFLGWAITQFFVAGFTRAALRAARSGQASFGDFFSAGSRYVPFLLTELLKSIAVAIGILLLIVPGIILALGFKNAPYYVIDQNLGPIAALRASWDSSEGQKSELFVLSLAQLGISLLGLAACCLGLFVAVPVVVISQAIVYMKMSGTALAPSPAAAPAYGGYAGGPPGY